MDGAYFFPVIYEEERKEARTMDVTTNETLQDRIERYLEEKARQEGQGR